MALSRTAKLGLWAFLAVDLVVVIAFVGLLWLRGERQQMLELRDIGTTVYPEARPVSPFQLIDQHGQPFTEARLAGQWSLVFFGFSSCPDICPLTLAELDQFSAALEQEPELPRPQLLFVTLDPARDSAPALAAYLQSFTAEFTGLTGTIDELAALAAQFFVAHTEPQYGGHAGDHDDAHGADPDHAPAAASADYVIEHSGHLSVINPRAELHAVMRPPHRDADLLAAYRVIVGD